MGKSVGQEERKLEEDLGGRTNFSSRFMHRWYGMCPEMTCQPERGVAWGKCLDSGKQGQGLRAGEPKAWSY